MLQDWLNNLGKVQLTPDPPNGINGQCVNAASSWSMKQGGPELRGDTAYSIWQNFNSSFYKRVTSGFVSGDIVFFAPNNSAAGTGAAGHVDIYIKPVGTGFQGADTDWNGSAILQLITHSLGGVVGAFRPVNNSGGKPVLDEATVLAYAYYFYGWNGFNGRPNAFDDGAGTAAAKKQFASFVGQDPLVIAQQMRDDQYGQAYKNELIKAFQGQPISNATVLAPGQYQVK